MFIVQLALKKKNPPLKQQGTFKKEENRVYQTLKINNYFLFKEFFRALMPALEFHFLEPGAWKAFFQSG